MILQESVVVGMGEAVEAVQVTASLIASMMLSLIPIVVVVVIVVSLMRPRRTPPSADSESARRSDGASAEHGVEEGSADSR